MATDPPAQGPGSGDGERSGGAEQSPQGHGSQPGSGPDPGRRRGLVALMASNIAPNWYASVMGTGIVAVAAATLPQQFRGLHTAATVVWALAAATLIVLAVADALQWRWHPAVARSRLTDLAKGHFNGAPPVAILVVGAGTLLYGDAVFAQSAAVDIDWVLWFLGTVLGLACTGSVLYLLFTRSPVDLDAVQIGWLMCVVPPMVSAATGALLVPYAAAGQDRLALLLACYAMFGLSLLVSAIAITLTCQRLAVHKTGRAATVPTLWIVLGPLGQSVTAANALGAVSGLAVNPLDAAGLRSFGVVFGVPVWGFATLWAALAAALTARTKSSGLPFSLAWWSFTFPLGTYVTATTTLALRTGSDPFRVYAAVLYIALVLIWLRVALLTAHRGRRAMSVPAPR